MEITETSLVVGYHIEMPANAQLRSSGFVAGEAVCVCVCFFFSFLFSGGRRVAPNNMQCRPPIRGSIIIMSNCKLAGSSSQPFPQHGPQDWHRWRSREPWWMRRPEFSRPNSRTAPMRRLNCISQSAQTLRATDPKNLGFLVCEVVWGRLRT